MVEFKKIITSMVLLTLPLLIQCGGGEDDDGQVAESFPGGGDGEVAAFFSAPTEYGYSFLVVEEEGKPFLLLHNANQDIEVLRLPGESGEPVAFNYWNGFVYYGEMIGGSVEEGGVCSVKMFDEDSGENHVLCVVETEPADRLYGQVIAAAGLVFVAAETDYGEAKELFISCFDIETGEDLAEWTGVGEDIEFAGGCGTATPETVFFQIREGREYTLHTRNGRTFEDIHAGVFGRFDPDAGYWLFAEEGIPYEGIALEIEGNDTEASSLLPDKSDDISVLSFPVYYSYNLRDGEINPLLLSRDTGGGAVDRLIDGDPATVWVADDNTETEVRIGFGAPLRAGSMYIIPCHSNPDEFEKYNRVKQIQVETSSGFFAEIEFPDEMLLYEIQLYGEAETPPEINWAAVSVLDIYGDEENGKTCIAEISFDIR